MKSFQNKFKRFEQPLLSLDQVNQFHNTTTQVLHHISLNVMPGEVIYISGQSGAGKTTLLKICSLLLPPSQGKILFRGQPVYQLSKKKQRNLRQSIGVIPQIPIFIPHYTVYQNLALPLRVAGFCAKEIHRRVEEMLWQINLNQYQSLYPRHLSGGEQECLSVARALITHPLLVIADEPLGHGDHRLVKFMMDFLLQANKFGVSLLIATHDLTQIARSKTRALFLRDGRFINEEAFYP